MARPAGGGSGISSIGPVLPRPYPTIGRELRLSQRRSLADGEMAWLPLDRSALYAAVVALILIAVLVVGLFPDTISSTPEAPTLRSSQIAVPGMAGAAGWERPAALPRSVPERIAQLPVYTVPTAPAVSEVQPAPVDAPAESSPLGDTDVGALARQPAVPVPAAAVAPERAVQPRPLFFRYEVQSGDTVTGIAQRFGIATNYILWNNIDIIDDADVLTVGEELQVPSVGGIIHGIRIGETLYEIAERYDAKVVEIIEVNDLPSDGFIRAGATILVPGGRIVARPAARIAPTPAATAAPARVAATAAASSGSGSGFNFVWPTRDIITSYFGPSHPLGIDIRAPVGTPIKAAADGTVIFVGGTRCCSYGLYVEVAHDGGFTTLYAHLRDFAVENGDEVKSGTVLGFAGLTGRTTGPHLHFEIELNGVRRNPMLYLSD